jgi:hypothetical protein
MFRDKERHRRHRTRLFFFPAVESGVGQGGGGQLDLAAQVQDLRDLRRRGEAVEAQFVERQFQPAVDLALRQVVFTFRRRQLRAGQQHRRERRAAGIGLQVHGDAALFNHWMLIFCFSLRRSVTLLPGHD